MTKETWWACGTLIPTPPRTRQVKVTAHINEDGLTIDAPCGVKLGSRVASILTES
jgi:hypothetical protein